VLGGSDPYVAARRALLDALDALGAHADSVVVVGAQAVFLHTGQAQLAVAPFTKDADLVVDPRSLGDEPTVDAAMQAAGFSLDATKHQPGAWLSPEGVPVDLMVPEVDDPGRRCAPPATATSPAPRPTTTVWRPPAARSPTAWCWRR
jgi:hypothetical protein